MDHSNSRFTGRLLNEAEAAELASEWLERARVAPYARRAAATAKRPATLAQAAAVLVTEYPELGLLALLGLYHLVFALVRFV